jgi:hypothetical protein
MPFSVPESTVPAVLGSGIFSLGPNFFLCFGLPPPIPFLYLQLKLEIRIIFVNDFKLIILLKQK